MKNYLIAFIIVLILVTGIAVGLILVNQQQIFKQQAATPTGQTTVSIQPAQASFQRNSPNTISVFFNTSGILVSGVKVRLTYSNIGVAASGIQISPTLLASGDWTCPIKSVSATGSTGQIDISCVNSSAAGYSNNTDTLLATFSLTASEVPVINPLIISFDPQESTITNKASGQDILLTPASTGSYTITDTIAQSPTAPPVIIVTNPTATPLGTLRPTATAIATASSSAFLTPTATASATIPPVPVTGFDAPTIILAAGGGILLLISAFAFIL